MPNSDELA